MQATPSQTKPSQTKPNQTKPNQDAGIQIISSEWDRQLRIYAEPDPEPMSS